jgi:hypothetical protein
MKVNIQSISDIITNSSTEVYTIYSIRDKQTIKEIVNALLSVNGDLRFDDLFNIGMMVSEWAAETLWEACPELQEQFPTLNDFDNYLATLTDDELENYADKYDNLDIWYARPFYDGYFVSVKDDVEQTPVLERAIRAIHSFDSLFEHDVFEC